MSDENQQLAVVEQKQMVVSAPVHRTRDAICAAVGISDDSSKSLSVVIKTYLKNKGLKGADLQAEYYRILREDTAPLVSAKVAMAISNGWLQEIRTYNLDKKTGEETKFAVIYSQPKVAKTKALSVSQQEKILAAVGGKDSAQGKQILEYLTKNGMLAKVKVTEVVAEVVQEKVVSEQPA